MKEESFEGIMTELEKVVNELENGELSLENSIKKFEYGMSLSKKCNEILNDAEKRITILTKNENEEISEENFEN